MANVSAQSIPLPCPKCSHGAARPIVISYSIITIACDGCAYQWTVEIARLPEDVRTQIPNVERREHRERSA